MLGPGPGHRVGHLCNKAVLSVSGAPRLDEGRALGKVPWHEARGLGEAPADGMTPLPPRPPAERQVFQLRRPALALSLGLSIQMQQNATSRSTGLRQLQTRVLQHLASASCECLKIALVPFA
jgi:hypothetical protein